MSYYFDYKPKSASINWEWGLNRSNNSGWWDNVSKNFNLTQEDVRQNVDKINWHYLSENRKFPFDENFLVEFEDKIDWHAYVANHRISEKTYLRFKEHISLSLFLKRTTENKVKMVRKYFDQLSGYRAEYQYVRGEYQYSERDEIFYDISLPEKFLEENAKDDREWEIIAQNQKLSKAFLEKHWDKFKFIDLMKNHRLYGVIKDWFPKEYEKFKETREGKYY